MSPLKKIRQIDYTVIFARDLPAMRHFYQTVMEFEVSRELSETWIEYRIGSTILALTVRGGLFDDAPPPENALSLQLAFRVDPDTVTDCARLLEERGVELAYPLTDHDFGHRTIFFRDPDGNVIEIYAEI